MGLFLFLENKKVVKILIFRVISEILKKFHFHSFSFHFSFLESKSESQNFSLFISRIKVKAYFFSLFTSRYRWVLLIMVMVKEVGKSDNLIPSLRVVIPPLVLHSVSSTIYYHYVVQYMLYYTSYIIYYPTQGDSPSMVLIFFSTSTKQRYTDS